MYLFITFFVILIVQYVLADLKSCNGGLDLYFVLDDSGSVGAFFYKQINFVESILNSFNNTNNLLRASLITFNGANNDGIEWFPLTDDKTIWSNTFNTLRV